MHQSEDAMVVNRRQAEISLCRSCLGWEFLGLKYSPNLFAGSPHFECTPWVAAGALVLHLWMPVLGLSVDANEEVFGDKRHRKTKIHVILIWLTFDAQVLSACWHTSLISLPDILNMEMNINKQGNILKPRVIQYKENQKYCNDWFRFYGLFQHENLGY